MRIEKEDELDMEESQDNKRRGSSVTNCLRFSLLWLMKVKVKEKEKVKMLTIETTVEIEVNRNESVLITACREVWEYSSSSSTELYTHHLSMTREQIFENMLMTSYVLQFAVESGNIQTVVVHFSTCSPTITTAREGVLEYAISSM